MAKADEGRRSGRRMPEAALSLGSVSRICMLMNLPWTFLGVVTSVKARSQACNLSFITCKLGYLWGEAFDWSVWKAKFLLRMRFIYLIIHKKFLCNWNKFYKFLWIIINNYNINTSEIIYRYNNYIGYDDWIIARKSESIDGI